MPGTGPNIGEKFTVAFNIDATDLSTPTIQDIISPVDGYISAAYGIVQVAIVTGGDITFLAGTTAVDGLTLTIANSATKGTVVSDTPTAGHASRRVTKGQRLQVSPGAAFNGGGAVRGFIEITTSDLAQ